MKTIPESSKSVSSRTIWSNLQRCAFMTCILLVSGVFQPAAVRAEALEEGEGEIVTPLAVPPEGVAVDKSGNVFVSDFAGRVLRFDPKGNETQVCQAPPPAVGLAVDAVGNAYVAALDGVYRVDRDGSGCEHIPGTEVMVYANSLAFDKVGNLYVTDSVAGQIYRISTWGQEVELWLDHPLLKPVPIPGVPLVVGANGVQYWKGHLIVANTSQFKILRIPIEGNGSAGTPGVLFDASTPLGPLFVPDGIALDVYGNVYVADPGISQLVRVSRDGQDAEILANGFAGAPLDNPTSLAFGTGKGDRKNVYMVNAFVFGPPDHVGPSLVKFGTGNAGNPLP